MSIPASASSAKKERRMAAERRKRKRRREEEEEEEGRNIVALYRIGSAVGRGLRKGGRGGRRRGNSK